MVGPPERENALRKSVGTEPGIKINNEDRLLKSTGDIGCGFMADSKDRINARSGREQVVKW